MDLKTWNKTIGTPFLLVQLRAIKYFFLTVSFFFFFFSINNYVYQGGKSIMRYYNNDIVEALNACFPTLNLIHHKFNKFNGEIDELQFITNFAKKHFFDPNWIDSWTSEVESEFKKEKVKTKKDDYY